MTSFRAGPGLLGAFIWRFPVPEKKGGGTPVPCYPPCHVPPTAILPRPERSRVSLLYYDELNTNPPTPHQIGKRPPAPKPKREPAGHQGAAGGGYEFHSLNFPLSEGSRVLGCPKKKTPSTARPLSRGPPSLIGLPFSVWTGACYWHGVGGYVFNAPSQGLIHTRTQQQKVMDVYIYIYTNCAISLFNALWGGACVRAAGASIATEVSQGGRDGGFF